MFEKSLKTEITLNETPNFKVIEERRLNKENNQTKKVDINVLKARVQRIESKEKKKNIFIFVFILTVLAVVGIYVSI